MFRNVRGAAFVAAFFMLAGGATYARPSFAEEINLQVTAPVYSSHIEASPLQLEPAPLPAPAAPAAPAAAIAVDEEKLPSPPPVAETRPKSLRDLVVAHSDTNTGDPETECLAGAVYFESKGEPLEGQLAVAEVILNRAGSGRYPSSICGVVKQKSQFSFVRGGRIPAIPKSTDAWRKAVAIAHIAKKDLADSSVGKAMFFHARYVSPGWKRLTRVTSIGNHIFYR